MRWRCPACNHENDTDNALCICGYKENAPGTSRQEQNELTQTGGRMSVAAAQKTTAARTIEVVSAAGETITFAAASDLRKAILDKLAAKNLKARWVTVDAAGKRTEAAWITVEKLAIDHPELRSLYRPIWHYTMQYIAYGVIAGIALKFLDTTILLVSSGNGGVIMLWLLVIASLFLAKKWPIAPIAVVFLSIKLGVRANLFITALATMLVGAMFGAPLGMIVGTAVGHFKSKSISRALDAEPEGRRPYRLGIVIPLLALAVLIPLYIWFNFKMMEWMDAR
jgi:hypothetical protein